MKTLRKVLLSIGCLGLGGVGVALAAGLWTLEDLRSDRGSGRSRALRSTLASLVESIGAVPTGRPRRAARVGALVLGLAAAKGRDTGLTIRASALPHPAPPAAPRPRRTK